MNSAERQERCSVDDPRWLGGSIRRKLTLFVVTILILVIGLFWFFSVFLLQPAYDRFIKNGLYAAMDVVVGILDEADREGVPLTTWAVSGGGSMRLQLSEECMDRLNAAVINGSLSLTNRCLEVSGADLQNLLLSDSLQPRCYLHPSYETGIVDDGLAVLSAERNGEVVSLVRRHVFSEGEYFNTELGQVIYGRTAAGGQLAVIITVNNERTTQALTVLRQLLVPLSLLLIILSTLSAWVFSRWFTKPISKLSVAAKEMAKGNYNVQVQDDGDDEIGELSRDFNRMAREVKRSSEMQRDLLANVSHDLRTPLTLIKGYAETIRDLTGDDAAKRNQQLDVIVDETDRLTSLVGSVLELTRVSSGNERAKPVRFDLAELCEEVAYRYQTASAQMGLNFVFLGEDPCEIEADPEQVERALHNLLGNAMKHVGPDGYFGLRVERTMHSTARVEVTDHGEGIDEKDLPFIFERYYRSRNDTGKQGTGLGLSITKAIFDANSFTYGVQSELGVGSQFWFEANLVSY